MTPIARKIISRKKNPRNYNERQLSELNKIYQMNPRPNRKSLQSLSEQLGINVDCIRVWLYRKQKREGGAKRERQGKLIILNYTVKAYQWSCSLQCLTHSRIRINLFHKLCTVYYIYTSKESNTTL